jgi:hypothetical protein
LRDFLKKNRDPRRDVGVVLVLLSLCRNAMLRLMRPAFLFGLIVALVASACDMSDVPGRFPAGRQQLAPSSQAPSLRFASFDRIGETPLPLFRGPAVSRESSLLPDLLPTTSERQVKWRRACEGRSDIGPAVSSPLRI